MKNKPRFYDKEGKLFDDITKYGKLMEDKSYSRIGLYQTSFMKISTVWLGLDHAWGDQNPLIFETMVFGLGGREEYQWRYSTLKEAQDGHKRIVRMFRWRIDLILRGIIWRLLGKYT